MLVKSLLFVSIFTHSRYNQQNNGKYFDYLCIKKHLSCFSISINRIWNYKSNYVYLIKRQLNSSRKRAFFCNVFNRDFNSNGIKYIYVLIKPWPGLNMTSEFSLSWLCNLLMIIASIWFRFLCVTRYYSKLSIKKENQRWHFQIFHTFIFSPKYFSTFQRLKLSIHRSQKNQLSYSQNDEM